MKIIDKRYNSYFLEPGQMVVDSWYSQDYKPDIEVFSDLWLFDDDRKPQTIEVWLGYKRKSQIKRDGGVFFNEGKYGHALDIMCVYVADAEDETWQDEYPTYEWVKVG